jgi:hypothetical protein
MSAAIRAALRTVADKRADCFAAAEALRLKKDAFDIENAALIVHLADEKKAVEAAEANARALLLVHYNATKEKAPVEGAEVKLGKVYKYSVERAFEWAKKTGMCLIPESLDEAAFLKIAKATPLPFVTVEEERKAFLATKLNPALLAEPVNPIVAAALNPEIPF